MSPSARSNSRAELEAQLRNVKTGDPEVDSLLSREVTRRATFAPPGTPARVRPVYGTRIPLVRQVGQFLGIVPKDVQEPNRRRS